MFEIYKRGQGTTARWIAAAGLGGLAAFGCYELHDFLEGITSASVNLGFVRAPVRTLVSGLAFVGAAVLIAWLINLPKCVDYLIMSEVELRKVSWPTRDELKRQTIVVIVALVAFALVLLIADLVFALGSTRFYGLG